MSYTINIVRDVESKTTTLSKFTMTNDITGEVMFNGYGCEPGGPSTTASGKNKRIVPGEYRIRFTDSARNGSLTKKYSKWNPKTFFKQYPQYQYSQNVTGRNVTLWVVNGTNFDHRRILIHVGNSCKDTLGCYLLGKWRNINAMTVSNSLVALDEFYSLVLKVGPENIKYIIKEEF
jgi:hypothetical protein